MEVQYNFDQVVNRRQQQSKKWTAYQHFGVPVSDEILPLWIADMDFKCEPRIRQALQAVVDYGIYGYDAPADDFFSSFIDWQEQRNHWQVSSDFLVPVSGVVPGICNAIRSLTQAGDRILIQTPVYYPFFKAIETNQRCLVENPLIRKADQYVIDFADFEEKIKTCKMFILCSPHNPVGRVWRVDELQKMAELCLKHGVIIVADEIHSDLIFKGYKHTPLASLSSAIDQQTITLMAPSKSFNVAGLSQSVAIIANPEIRQRFEEGLCSSGFMHMNSFAAAGFPAAYRYGGDWLDQALTYIEANVDYVLDYLTERLPEVDAHRPEGTFLMWLDFTEVSRDPEVLMHRLIHQGKIILEDGSIFGQQGRGFCRFNIASPRSIIEEAMSRIETAIHS